MKFDLPIIRLSLLVKEIIVILKCHQIFVTAISKEEADDAATRGQLPYNGYSEEFLDRLEPNGNIPADKDRRYGVLFTNFLNLWCVQHIMF